MSSRASLSESFTPLIRTYSTVILRRLGSWKERSASMSTGSGYARVMGMRRCLVELFDALSDTARAASVSFARVLSRGTIPQVEMVTLLRENWGPSTSVRMRTALTTLS